MRIFTDSRGVDYPLTDKQASEFDAAFGSSWPTLDGAKILLNLLLKDSSERVLTAQERLQIAACDQIININRAIKFLNGRDHTEMVECIDQVHGNTLRLPCGCHLSHIFDHHLRDQPEKTVLHPHHPLQSCNKHAHLLGNFKLHHATVIAEHKAAPEK